MRRVKFEARTPVGARPTTSSRTRRAVLAFWILLDTGATVEELRALLATSRTGAHRALADVENAGVRLERREISDKRLRYYALHPRIGAHRRLPVA